MSISEQHLKLGNGLFSPILSVYSASMVGVFCALILMVEAAMPALFALSALLISYLLTCIFIFGSFRGVLNQTNSGDGSQFQLGLPNGFVVLFCVASLFALFGTYSALGPITSGGAKTVAHKTGGITQRNKGSFGPAITIDRQVASEAPTAQSAISGKSGVLAPVVREKPVDATRPIRALQPILASVRSDELIGVRTVRSHAWAIRETANLPVMLRLPEVLFGILYGEDVAPTIEPNMVVAKQNGNSTARIMVSFLTAPHESFKNRPAAKTGGIIVVQKRETVLALRPAGTTVVEPFTVVRKSPETNQATSSETVVARVDPAPVRSDPVGVASTKQDVLKVALADSQRTARAQRPNLLLPPVLASIFYGRPSAALDPTEGQSRAPRLTTLFKTAAPQAIQFAAEESVTVVAKIPDSSRQRHPIALAALADNHRILEASGRGLGGPFNAMSGAATKVASIGGDDIVTGSISRRQINSAIRSLRFAPQIEKDALQSTKQSSKEAPRNVGASLGREKEMPVVREQVSQQLPSNRPVTVVLKNQASAEANAPRAQGPAPAALNSSGGVTEAYKLAEEDGASAAVSPALEARGQASPVKISADGNTLIQKTSSVSSGDVKLDLSERPAPAAISETRAKPKKAKVSSEAMRRANEEINSALRGAEADLKDTDVLLEEIDVIWSDHDTKKRRPKAKGRVKRVPARKENAVVINPASEVLSVSTEARKQDAQLAPQRISAQSLAQSASTPINVALNTAMQRKSVAASAPPKPKQQLLGYIRERGSLKQGNSYTDCAVMGPDSKLRSCAAGRRSTKL